MGTFHHRMVKSFIFINSKNKATAINDLLFLALSEEKKQDFYPVFIYFVPELLPRFISSVCTKSVNEVLMCM